MRQVFVLENVVLALESALDEVVREMNKEREALWDDACWEHHDWVVYGLTEILELFLLDGLVQEEVSKPTKDTPIKTGWKSSSKSKHAFFGVYLPYLLVGGWLRGARAIVDLTSDVDGVDDMEATLTKHVG